jgi:hypothetical protein
MCAFTATDELEDTSSNNDIIEPLSYAEAMASPQRKQWSKAMIEEINALIKKGVFKLGKLPYGKTAIGCKWVFKLKRDADGNIVRFKARLVAQGFTQKKDRDFYKTFAPVARMTSQRIVISIASLENLNLYTIDVENAYLNGDIDTQLFMKQPPGFVDPKFPHLVLELQKGLYGLKQAGNIWNTTIHSYLLEIGFVSITSDKCVYVKSEGGRPVAALHVDDFLLAATPEQFSQFTSALTAKFSSKFQVASSCLGMRILKLPSGGYSIDQQAYLESLLSTFGMTDCKPSSTPMAKGEVDALVSGNTGAKLLDSFQQQLYRKIVGKLMYAMVGTRPDLAHALSVLGRYAAKPDTFHLAMAKKVLAYVKSTINFKLVFSNNRGSDSDSILLKGYVDSDYANDSERKSTTGFCFFMGNNLISWCSKRQVTIATSTTVAEYFALYEATIETVCLRAQLKDLSLPQHAPTILFEDNQTAIRLAADETSHKRTKHIDVKYRYTKEQQDLGTLTIRYIPSEENLADFFTKQLPRVQFHAVCKQLGLFSSTDSKV